MQATPPALQVTISGSLCDSPDLGEESQPDLTRSRHDVRAHHTYRAHGDVLIIFINQKGGKWI